MEEYQINVAKRDANTWPQYVFAFRTDWMQDRNKAAKAYRDLQSMAGDYEITISSRSRISHSVAIEDLEG